MNISRRETYGDSARDDLASLIGVQHNKSQIVLNLKEEASCL